ncbi:MAG: glutamate synthase [Colwellia sp.]|nr:MAG: glutamate synthase [Colwellia sp.]
MKSMSIKVLLASTLSLFSLLASAGEKVPSQNTLDARALVKAFGGDLKHVLKTSMKSGGPIKALAQCNTQAGPIAKKNSTSSGWDIGRTSLKVRNESNAPDEWESIVLRQFEKRKAAGESLKTMEYSETVKDGDKLVYRYMKPIPTAGLCLTCHGGDVSEEVTKKVQLLYPNDQATGFTVGDIRGAFTLQKTNL